MSTRIRRSASVQRLLPATSAALTSALDEFVMPYIHFTFGTRALRRASTSASTIQRSKKDAKKAKVKVAAPAGTPTPVAATVTPTPTPVVASTPVAISMATSTTAPTLVATSTTTSAPISIPKKAATVIQKNTPQAPTSSRKPQKSQNTPAQQGSSQPSSKPEFAKVLKTKLKKGKQSTSSATTSTSSATTSTASDGPPTDPKEANEYWREQVKEYYPLYLPADPVDGFRYDYFYSHLYHVMGHMTELHMITINTKTQSKYIIASPDKIYSLVYPVTMVASLVNKTADTITVLVEPDIKMRYLPMSGIVVARVGPRVAANGPIPTISEWKTTPDFDSMAPRDMPLLDEMEDNRPDQLYYSVYPNALPTFLNYCAKHGYVEQTMLEFPVTDAVLVNTAYGIS